MTTHNLFATFSIVLSTYLPTTTTLACLLSTNIFWLITIVAINKLLPFMLALNILYCASDRFKEIDMGKRVIVVGGVAGGASFAARMRRLDETCEIVMFERGKYISFANCGLPYHIGGEIKERSRLIVQTPENFKAVQNVDVRINSEVTSIDTERKSVSYTDKSGAHELSYDALLLAPGATPMRPPIPGIDGDNIYTLRNIPDMDRIKKVIDSGDIKHTVVVGGGFIGLEIAENLRHKKIDVALVEFADQVFAPADKDLSMYVERELLLNGVEVITSAGAKEFIHSDNKITVDLTNGDSVKTDLVIFAAGVIPDTKFLKNSGIDLTDRGAIITADTMETSAKDVYAVGDAVQVVDFNTDAGVIIPLAGPANRQGRIAADNINGGNSTYKKTQGTSICKVFNLTAATTGINEKGAQRNGISYEKVYTHSYNHAGYYPGATMMSIKLLFSPTDGKVLGAQIMGQDGVDRRIDILATAIRQELTVIDLIDMELAYAPPFGNAKDAVNMLGFVGENILNGKLKQIFSEELDATYDPKTMQLVDVRTREEQIVGYLKGAVLIPHGEIRRRMDELDKSKEIIVYCGIGQRGYVAARILENNGFKVRNLSGGFNTYSMIHLNSVESLKVLQDGSLPEPMAVSKPYGAPVIEESRSDENDVAAILDIDACGLQCPGPILKLKSGIDQVNHGDVIKVSSNDPGFVHDIPAWCRNTGNTLLAVRSEGKIHIASVKKGTVEGQSCTAVNTRKKTMVVFSNDFDKLMATFIIANGAAAMNDEVTLFFTFWGLNALRKSENVPVKKNMIEKMFSFMMPQGVEKTVLSKMNMGGMGTKMMQSIMKNKNVMSLKELMDEARRNGVRFIACAMSMDLMGIKEEELIDGVEIGGVGMYLGEASESSQNMFI